MTFNLLITSSETGEVVRDIKGCMAIVAGLTTEQNREEIVLVECTKLDLARAIVAAEDAAVLARKGERGIRRCERFIRETEQELRNEEE